MKMELQSKIIFTLLFIISYYIMLKLYKINNGNLKKTLEIINPELIKKQPWFFSESKDKIIKTILALIILYLLISIWSE